MSHARAKDGAEAVALIRQARETVKTRPQMPAERVSADSMVGGLDRLIERIEALGEAEGELGTNRPSASVKWVTPFLTPAMAHLSTVRRV